MKKITTISHILLIFLLVGFCRCEKQDFKEKTPPPSEEGVYFISPSGNDQSGRGTIESPWATLTYATKKMQAGDVLYVRGGNYQLSTTALVDGKMGIEGQPITIMAYQNEIPVFDGKGISGSNHILQLANCRYVTVDGLECKYSNANGIRVNNCEYVVIRNCLVHDTQHNGVTLIGNHCLLENNEIYRAVLSNENGAQKALGKGWSQAVSVNGAGLDEDAQTAGQTVASNGRNNIVRGNYIHDSWGEGIDAIFASGTIIEHNRVGNCFSIGIYNDSSEKTVVRGNFVYVTDPKYNQINVGPMVGFQVSSEWIQRWWGNGNKANMDKSPLAGCSDFYIYNNIFTGVGSGIRYWRDKNNLDPNSSYHNMHVMNNVFDLAGRVYGKVLFMDEPNTEPTGCTFKNNICWGLSSKLTYTGDWVFSNNWWVNGLPALGEHPHSFTGDPGCVNPSPNAPEGYRLSGNSGCIGKGVAIDFIKGDFWGKARNVPPSIGAHEFGSQLTAGTDILPIDFSIPENVGIPLLANAGFEEGERQSPAGWAETGDVGTSYADNVDAFEGQRSLVHFDGMKAYAVSTFQTKVVQNGRYGLKLYFKTSANAKAKVMVDGYGGEAISVWLPGGKDWYYFTISNIIVSSQNVTIRFQSENSPAGESVRFDQVWLFRY